MLVTAMQRLVNARAKMREYERLRRSQTAVQINRANDGFQHGGADRAGQSGRGTHSFAKPKRLVQFQLNGDLRAHLPAHRVAFYFGEITLQTLRQRAKQMFTHHKTKHRVAQKFLALIAL